MFKESIPVQPMCGSSSRSHWLLLMASGRGDHGVLVEVRMPRESTRLEFCLWYFSPPYSIFCTIILSVFVVICFEFDLIYCIQP